MSVCLYYTARRATPLTTDEADAVRDVVAAGLASFPYDDEESIYLYDRLDPGVVLAGSTKMPRGEDRLVPVLEHTAAAVSALRRAVPDADWHVHVEDQDLTWDEDEGYWF